MRRSSSSPISRLTWRFPSSIRAVLPDWFARSRRMSLTRTEWVCLAALALLTLGTLIVPLMARRDPLAIGDVLSLRLIPPFAVDSHGEFHLLGTDRFGRDLFVRMMLAGRLSLAIGVVGSTAAAAVGTLVGAVAAWHGGVADRVAMAMADALLAIPRLVLLLVCAALWQPGLTTVVVVLIATGWMGVARLVRGEVLGVRTQPYVDAATALGARPRRVLLRHALPNALGPAIVAATLGVGNAILLESGLSFLGLGIQPPQPSWGNMIAGGRDLIVSAPWVAISPGIALIATVLACTLLGDSLRDRLAGESGATLRDRA
jgi:peptide/nickel transport system permease protein